MREISASNARSWATLYIIALMYIVLNAMNMVTWQQTVQIEYDHQAHLHATRDNTQGIMPDQLLDTIPGTGTDIAG